MKYLLLILILLKLSNNVSGQKMITAKFDGLLLPGNSIMDNYCLFIPTNSTNLDSFSYSNDTIFCFFLESKNITFVSFFDTMYNLYANINEVMNFSNVLSEFSERFEPIPYIVATIEIELPINDFEFGNDKDFWKRSIDWYSFQDKTIPIYSNHISPYSLNCVSVYVAGLKLY